MAADGPLVALGVVALLLSVAMAYPTLRQLATYDAFAACQAGGRVLLDWLSAPDTAIPLVVLSVGLTAGMLALAHQAWVTRRVLGRTLARRCAGDGRLDAIAERAGLGGRVDLIADSAVYTFCYGMLRPRVCVSDGLAEMLGDDELAAVLRHEAHHMRHRDPLKILVSRTLASGLFFLPLAGALRNGYLGAKELYADADASAAGGDLPLARALVKLLGADRPVWPAGVLAVGAFSPTEARLRHLIERQAIRPALPSPAEWLASLGIVAGIFGLSTGAAAAGGAAPVQPVCSPPAIVRSEAVPVHGASAATIAAVVDGTRSRPIALECDPRCLPGAIQAD